MGHATGYCRRVNQPPYDPKNPVISLPDPFVDERGGIQPLADVPMASALMITATKGTVRGNHTHKTDWHLCYIVSGALEYFWRPTGDDGPPRSVHAGPGTIIMTPAMTDHAFRFAEDTMFLTLAGNPRDQEAYEADISRIELISPE